MTSAATTPLTAAQKRALIVVRDSVVERYYDKRGNRIIAPQGVAAHTLWKLERRGLIRDRRGEARGILRIYVTMELTKAGAEALR